MININALAKTLLHEETLIGTVLADLHSVVQAQKLEKLASQFEHPIVSFGRKVEGHIAYGPEITEAALEHARIRISPKDASPEYRYFKRIHAIDGGKINAGEGHGLSASAWGEIDTQGQFLHKDGKCDLRICYPGYPPHSSSSQTQSMLKSLSAEFPQAREVGPFLDATMAKTKEMGFSVDGVINNSWSMGAANALSSNLYFKHRGVPTTAILGDSWRASAAVQNIAQRSNILRPLFNNSQAEALRYSQSELRNMLSEDVINVYPAIQNQAGKWMRTSTTAPEKYPIAKSLLIPSDKPVGKLFHIDVKNMKVLESNPILGDAHYRPNMINHLATHGDSLLHEAPQMAAQSAGHGVGSTR